MEAVQKIHDKGMPIRIQIFEKSQPTEGVDGPRRRKILYQKLSNQMLEKIVCDFLCISYKFQKANISNN